MFFWYFDVIVMACRQEFGQLSNDMRAGLQEKEGKRNGSVYISYIVFWAYMAALQQKNSQISSFEHLQTVASDIYLMLPFRQAMDIAG